MGSGHGHNHLSTLLKKKRYTNAKRCCCTESKAGAYPERLSSGTTPVFLLQTHFKSQVKRWTDRDPTVVATKAELSLLCVIAGRSQLPPQNVKQTSCRGRHSSPALHPALVRFMRCRFSDSESSSNTVIRRKNNVACIKSLQRRRWNREAGEA